MSLRVAGLLDLLVALHLPQQPGRLRNFGTGMLLGTAEEIRPYPRRAGAALST